MIFIVSIYLPISKCTATDNSETRFYDSGNCKTYLSFWTKEGATLTIFDKNGKPHFGKFQKFDTQTDSLYLIEKEFENNIKVNAIYFSNISKVLIEKKKFNMGQIKQATLIGSTLGFVGALIINKSNSDRYRKSNVKIKNLLLGFGIGAHPSFINNP